ncbi:MAG: DUF3179 domain-containing (seleno)protein [Chitinophagaceae bacterium]
MRKFILVAGLILLFAVEILRVYFIMPFPGSQKADTIGFAYWLGRNIIWLRILLAVILIYPVVYALRNNRRWKKLALVLVLFLYFIVFYFVNFRFEADKMFYQPTVKTFYNRTENKVDSNKLVLGVLINGQSKAYPVEVIGYHHQVRDSISEKPVMVTYCTVCRTGRVYSPLVNGKPEEFRLVGMDHFNAMFEDAGTKSWWQQATGQAIAGKLKGTTLEEIPSQQMTLASWFRLHPNSTVLQPDGGFKKRYDDLEGYDEGTIAGGLEHRDSTSWSDKSWVIGVNYAPGKYKAYDWNELVKKQVIQDSAGNIPLLLTLDDDGKSFHTFNRRLADQVFDFSILHNDNTMTDRQTGSLWTTDGTGIFGLMNGYQLERLPSYQEFWHSWKQFHPGTEK